MVKEAGLKAVKLTDRLIRPESAVGALAGAVAGLVLVIGVVVDVVIVAVVAVEVVRVVPGADWAVVVGCVVVAGGLTAEAVVSVCDLQAWVNDSNIMMRMETPSTLGFI
jgi:protein-S-isoprenylcysteine O-methyltransferase Ste14